MTCSVYPSVSFNDALLLVLMIIQYVREVLAYLRFGLWWVGLGVASSIGLGMNALLPLALRSNIFLEILSWLGRSG
jgi:hypothetical protein